MIFRNILFWSFLMPPPVFTQDDFDNLELARQIVLHRLRNDEGWTQLDYDWNNQFVTFENVGMRGRFGLLANEVMWQLITQGVLTPGMNAPNPTLPFFRITSYGRSVLETERFLPHDPTGYLDDVAAVAETEVGQAGQPYLEEALRCFQSGCNLASVLLLGVAAEAVFLKFCTVAQEALQDAEERERFEQLQSVRPKHRWVVEKYNSLPREARRVMLPESLDVTLTSLYELIRRQRNELGHPQEELPTIDREQAFMFFKLFPTFIQNTEAFAAYCRDNGL